MSRTASTLPTLSDKEALILELLSEADSMYGLELVSQSKGRLKRGTVYVTLGRMEDKGYIRSKLEDPPPSAGGMPRRIYEPTATGHRVFAAWSAWRKAVRSLKPVVAR